MKKLSNIIKTGYTKVGMRFISDVDNVDPTIVSVVAKIKFRKGGTNYYLPLVLPSDPSASYFRVRYGGVTMVGIHID